MQPVNSRSAGNIRQFTEHKFTGYILIRKKEKRADLACPRDVVTHPGSQGKRGIFDDSSKLVLLHIAFVGRKIYNGRLTWLGFPVTTDQL
jgi:hypothetical protein